MPFSSCHVEDICYQHYLSGFSSVLLLFFSSSYFSHSLEDNIVHSTIVHTLKVWGVRINLIECGFLHTLFGIFLHRKFVSNSHIICWKNYPFSIEFPLHHCQKSVDDIWMGLFLGCLFCFIALCICSFTNTMLAWVLEQHLLSFQIW